MAHPMIELVFLSAPFFATASLVSLFSGVVAFAMRDEQHDDDKREDT